MIIGNDVSVAVLWFVDLQVGVLPCELLTGVDGLQEAKDKDRTKRKHQRKITNEDRAAGLSLFIHSACFGQCLHPLISYLTNLLVLMLWFENCNTCSAHINH